MSEPRAFSTPTDKEFKKGPVVDVRRIGWFDHKWTPQNFSYGVAFRDEVGFSPVLVNKTVDGEKRTVTEERKGVLKAHVDFLTGVRAAGIEVIERKATKKKK